jgi:hypothetical protein
MSNDTFPSNLGHFAYIIVERANCLYRPEFNAAVRIVPPYGTKVDVIREQQEWVLIRFFGKEAWSHRSNLSNKIEEAKAALNVGIVPRFCDSHGRALYNHHSKSIEYGPRGGKFVRTASGFKRYF